MPRSAVRVAEGLEQQGFLVGVMRPPSVPDESSRLRITRLGRSRTADDRRLAHRRLEECCRGTSTRSNRDMFPARTGFEHEYPFESHEFRLDGLRYHYLDEGSGPTLLFVHGNPTWSFAFRNLIKALSPHYRVLAVDHIGCGFSDKPQNYPYRLAQHVENLERFVTGLDLRDITLFAHDWGGAIGMGVAARMPERFSRFVLFNTAAFRSRRMPLRIAICRIPGLGALGVRGLNLFSRAALRMAVARPIG